MSDLKKITKAAITFRDERDWEKFHTPKNLAIALSLEAGEVLEHFLWKSDTEIEKYMKTNKEEIADELADVLHYLVTLAHAIGVELPKASAAKFRKTAIKYPVEKSRGKATKYNKL
jgi:dCTP diphosphatase